MSKKVKGFKEFMKTPRQVPAPPGGHPVPPGFKRVPDNIAGWKLVPIQEGIGGAIIGGIAGAIGGGPIGAIAGAYAGHKIGQRASRNPSVLDAAISNKAADLLDRNRARRAAKAGQTRFRPSAISRYLRNVAVRKSGGIYAASADATEPVAGLVPTKSPTTKPTSKVTPIRKGIPVPSDTPEINPIHVNHPGHGETPAASTQSDATLRRIAAQKAVAARIRAQEKAKIGSNFDPRGTRQKKTRLTSNTILVPEQKGK